MDHENGANGNKSIPKKIYFHVLSTWLDAKFGNKLTSYKVNYCNTPKK